MTKFGLKPEWKMEVGATPITLEMEDAFNIMLDMNVTNQCSILAADINNIGGKYKSNISNYDEIKFYARYSGDSWVQMFGGYIDKISYRKTGEGDVMHVDLRSYEQQFFFKLLTKGYVDTCVEDIITDIVDQVNGNIANNFTYTGVGSAYEQVTLNSHTAKLYGNTGGGASTVGQSFKPTKENIITVGMKIIRVNDPADLICNLYLWDTNYATTIAGSAIATETIDDVEIPQVIAANDDPDTDTATTIFVLDTVGLDTTKTYLLDFKLASAGDGDNYYRIGTNGSGVLSNGILYEAGGAVGGEGCWCQFNLFVIDAQDKTAFETMRDICNRLGYDWYSNMSKDIRLEPRNITATETVITGEDVLSIDYCRDITPLANKIYVYGAEYPIRYPDELDDLTEPDDQTWVDNNWRSSVDSEVKMISDDNSAAFGDKYVEMRCTDKSQDDFLNYPETDADIVDSSYHSLYFVMKAGDITSAEPVTIRIEVEVEDVDNVSDTFYRDVTILKATWTEHIFRLPHLGSDAGWTGVKRYVGRRWDQIQHVRWQVRHEDSGSTNHGSSTVHIYGASDYVGQVWEACDTDIKQVIVKGRKAGTPAGALKCQLYKWDTSGDSYATAISGTLIASGTLAASEITTSDTTLTISMAMVAGQKLDATSSDTRHLLHFTQDGAGGDNSNDYILKYGTSTNNTGRYWADGVEQATDSIYFVADYVNRHAEYVSIDGLAFAGSGIVYSSVEDATSQSNFDTREHIIRKDDIRSTDEAIQKAKQTLRHLGWGDDSWTGNPGDTKDVQNNGFVSIPGRNDIIPTKSVTVQYSEANLDCDFRVDSVSHNFSKMTGWVTTLRLAMILPQMSIQEMLQHIITSVNEVKARKPTYGKGLSGVD